MLPSSTRVVFTANQYRCVIFAGVNNIVARNWINANSGRIEAVADGAAGVGCVTGYIVDLSLNHFTGQCLRIDWCNGGRPKDYYSPPLNNFYR